MISFASDYVAGAHPEIIKRLAETNMENLSRVWDRSILCTGSGEDQTVLSLPGCRGLFSGWWNTDQSDCNQHDVTTV